MVVWLKQPHFKPSLREPFLETPTTKSSEVPNAGSPKNYKRGSKIKTSFFPTTITHSDWNTCLRSKLCPNNFSFCTPCNLALIQPTSPLNRDPHFPKGNFISLISAFSSTLVLCYKYRAYQTTWFGLQAVVILNHVPTFYHQEHCMYQTTCPHSTN